MRVPWTARRSNQSILKEILSGRTDAEAEVPVLWPPDGNSQLIGKDPDAGKGGEQEEKGQQRMRCLNSITDSMEFEQTPGDSEGQGNLVCFSS